MGFLAALLAAFSGSAKDLTSKSVASKVHPDVSTFASFAFALPFYALLVPVAIYFGYEEPLLGWYFIGLVLLRSLTDVAAEGCKMRAFAHGDVSLVSNFLALTPVFLLFISPLVTGDRVQWNEAAAALLALSATLLLLKRDRRSGGVYQGRAIIYSCLAATAFALNSCFDRLAAVSSGPVISAFAMTFVAALFTIPAIRQVKNGRAQLSEWSGRFLARGVFESSFMTAKLVALSYLPAHVVASITGGSMILSVSIGGVWFHEPDVRRRLMVAIVIYAGVILLLV